MLKLTVLAALTLLTGCAIDNHIRMTCDGRCLLDITRLGSADSKPKGIIPYVEIHVDP